MRITNNMMLNNSMNNINGNKINVNNMNNQMSSQKKIQRPSENPVIAIRSLRLRSDLSEIDQYYENNIPDAESWLDVTGTAIKNMNSILTDIRELCIRGAQDSLTADDRNTILTQLEKLRDQVYAEGNAEYAGRTVFTGYHTDKKLTFTENEKNTSYDITQSFGFGNIEEHRYYSGDVKVPATKDEVQKNPIQDPKEATFDRIRFGYEGIDGIKDKNGNLLDANGANGAISYTKADGKTADVNVTVYDTFEDWAKANNGEYKIPEQNGQQNAVFIKESGEMILGKNASDEMRKGKATLNVDYTKTGFDKGELRPEYYYNCTNKTDAQNPVQYVKYDKNGKEIEQNIDYIVSAGQSLTVNTAASDVFDSSLYRDIDEMIEAVRGAQEANDKVTKIKDMMKQEQYSDDASQKKLAEWLKAAEKECDYADDNMQKLYNSYIGHCDKYLQKVNLANTDLGSKGQSLELTKSRMSSQQTTVETLTSRNENRDLSDIIIDYTAAYGAYEASLQAAAKVNQNTLLNFI